VRLFWHYLSFVGTPEARSTRRNQTCLNDFYVCPFEAHPQRLQPLFKSTENLIIAQKLNLDLRLGWISFGCYSKI